jgi:hypothetical protein
MVKDLVSLCGSESRPVNLKIAIIELSTPVVSSAGGKCVGVIVIMQEV